MRKYDKSGLKAKTVDNKFLLENVYTAMSTAEEIHRKSTKTTGQKMMGAYDTVNYSKKTLVELRNQLRVQLFSVTCGFQLFRQQHGDGELRFSQKFGKQEMAAVLQKYAQQVDSESRGLFYQFLSVIDRGRTQKPIELEQQTSHATDSKGHISNLIGVTLMSSKKQEEFGKQFEQKGRINMDPNFYGRPEKLQEIKENCEPVQKQEKIEKKLEKIEKKHEQSVQRHEQSEQKHEQSEQKHEQSEQKHEQSYNPKAEKWVKAIKVLANPNSFYRQRQKEVQWIKKEPNGNGKTNQQLKKLIDYKLSDYKFREEKEKILKLSEQTQLFLLKSLKVKK